MSASGDRSRRFERLERARSGLPGADERPNAGERFQGLEAGRPPLRDLGVPEAARDRFRPAAERPPELQTADGGEQPFVRCLRCETDNSRSTPACTTCGEALHTDAQRAFNAALWARRREEDAAQEREIASRHVALREAEAEAALARRQAAEALARRVGQQERERLDREEGGLFSRLVDLLGFLLRP